ncbi:unnamed protein product, partial [Adineta steineri]
MQQHEKTINTQDDLMNMVKAAAEDEEQLCMLLLIIFANRIEKIGPCNPPSKHVKQPIKINIHSGLFIFISLTKIDFLLVDIKLL